METIQRFLYMVLGATLTFLLFALTDARYIGREGFILWLILFLGPLWDSVLQLGEDTL
jgi:hypothetical protein